ncbi:NOPCHAP1/New4 family protein [Aspergillus lucknowensis]|uniref:Uncharacterized protein n=1 Tax=Aspergillus lucknowensis TaxID=176173 RepID=A0ABR4LLI3_9EURO
MDDVPRKRPQPDDDQSLASHSIALPKRSRSDEPTCPVVTTSGQREDLATPAVNARKGSPPTHSDEDDDYTSSSGSSLSSSSDDEDEDEDNNQSNLVGETSLNGDGEQITSLPARQKPDIRRIDNPPSLLTKLSAFLPQMKSANEDLQREIAAGRMKEIQLDNEDEQGDGQYIEMKLGLGVLEERRRGSHESFSDEEGCEPENKEASRETNVMDRLMKREKTSSSDKPSIQEING